MSQLLPVYDVIVVGAGHAGCEAACAAANLGSKTLLITLDMNKIAQMSCNPAMGGIAKGQIVREIDALGGGSGIVTDKSTIQFRMLNLSKGPAMWSPRAQCDRMIFSAEWRDRVEHTDNLDLWQDDVIELLLDKDRVTGVKTRLGISFSSRCVILTNGTFLNGLMHIGRVSFPGGRISEPATYGLSDQLKEYGFAVGRMKTGTPVRIDGRSIDFSKLTRQDGDNDFHKFSFLSFAYTNSLEKRPCYIAYTNKVVHDILREGFDDSPLFNGTIKSIGPRYCPSIETKLDTFSDRDSHHLFLEPEGEKTTEYYLNGFSSSLPWDIQLRALRNVEGFENVKIFRPGYAIEYDFFDPRDLKQTLESKYLHGLFFAGQINGTTGYEEAAAQGLLAGLNAARYSADQEGWFPRRDQAYIGVLVDDLCTLGTKEPYRMFTSRAEYRLMLREDNADARLTETGRELGLVDDARWAHFSEKMELIEKERQRLRDIRVHPQSESVKEINAILNTPLSKEATGEDLLRRPEMDYNRLMTLSDFAPGVNSPAAAQQVEIQVKYEGYISRQQDEIQRQLRNENATLPVDLDYKQVSGLSNEVVAKLNDHKPTSIGQASRISGITPAAISILLVWLKKQGLLRRSA